METIQIYHGFTVKVDEDGIIAAPCGCPECDDSVQSGHYACAPSPDFLLTAERTGRVFRAYHDGRWCWFAVRDLQRSRLHQLLRSGF